MKLVGFVVPVCHVHQDDADPDVLRVEPDRVAAGKPGLGRTFRSRLQYLLVDDRLTAVKGVPAQRQHSRQDRDRRQRLVEPDPPKPAVHEAEAHRSGGEHGLEGLLARERPNIRAARQDDGGGRD